MSIDWDDLVLGPVMGIFGEGEANVSSSLPIYHPKGSGSFQLVDAVYDAQYARVAEQGDGSDVSTSTPVLGVRRSRFSVPPRQGDRVTIPSAGTTYRVSDIQSDGHGHLLLILIEAQ